MDRKKAKPKYRALLISMAVSVAILILGLEFFDELNFQQVMTRLLWPLFRLMTFIGIGLAAGQIIEASGWSKYLGALAAPLFRFGNLGRLCSSAFSTAFFSGVAANAMLLDFYKEGKISRRQLFLTNFVNQLPAYFLHLPTTFFIVVSLTRWAGILYFVVTFAATLLRTLLFLVYGHFRPFETRPGHREDVHEPEPRNFGKIWNGIKQKFPTRIINIAVYVLPIYIFIFVINAMGFFTVARNWMAQYVVTTFIPVEALSMVILSFAAEFTSGFAAAGALLDAGVITTKQTVLALLIGNIIAFPIRALRHQLPRYIGIFSPKMGTQLLLMGQGFRVVSLVIMGTIYYYLG